MSLESSRSKTGIEAMEDLFTLGRFEEAYEMGETELKARLSSARLPRALLAERVVPASEGAQLSSSAPSPTVSSATDPSSQHQGPQSRVSSSTSNSSASNAKPQAPTASHGGSGHSPRDRSSHYKYGFGPHEADVAGLASSSSPFVSPPNTKPREVTYSSLAPSDKETLRTLVNDALPYLAVMVQCLFELNQRSSIAPFLKRICGPSIEDYPFELAYLLINLYVTEKDFDQARSACDSLISQIRSVLGPLPIAPTSSMLQSSIESANHDNIVEVADSDIAKTPTKDKEGAEKFSAPNSASSSPGTQHHIEYEEEDEETMALRRNFQALLQLYIFHILCATEKFADAKLFLFMEARLHPNIIQEWAIHIDEQERQHIEEFRRRQSEKKAAEINSSNGGVEVSNGESNPLTHVETIQRRSNFSFWNSDSSVGEEENGSKAGGAELGTPGNAIGAHRNESMFKRVMRYIESLYSFVKQRYDALSESQKIAVLGALVATLVSLAAIISYARKVGALRIPEWITSLLGLTGSTSKPAVIGAAAARANSLRPSQPPKMAYYGAAPISRTTLGAAQPSLSQVPRYR